MPPSAFLQDADPGALYYRPAHSEVFPSLLNAVLEKQGLIVVTGEAGMGKTALLHRLIRFIPADRAYVSVLWNAAVHPDGIVRPALAGFGFEQAGSDPLRRMQEFATAANHAGRSCLLVIDEAQSLSTQAFEGVRRLARLGTEGLLQIVLAGRPELRNTLPVAVKLEVQPLAREEVAAYIRFRWTRAGGGNLPFDEDSIEAIAARSQGVPRLINDLCEQALAQEPVSPGIAPPERVAPVPELRLNEIHTEPAAAPPGSPLLPFKGTDQRAAEQYRIIRTKIHHHAAQPRMVLVSSPMPGDGKTVNAVNLAGALALQEDVRVLLADCDFHRSAVSPLLGIRSAPGLCDLLQGQASVESALVRLEQFPNLYVLPRGDSSANPSELLSTSRWPALMELFRREFDYAIFDAPPVATVADYDHLQMACDGVVLVARPDHTNRQLWRKALETVPREKRIGAILNCAEDWFLWKTHGYYYYSANGVLG